eukprot:3874516-Karenia_brevis.AAC.1
MLRSRCVLPAPAGPVTSSGRLCSITCSSARCAKSSGPSSGSSCTVHSKRAVSRTGVFLIA